MNVELLRQATAADHRAVEDSIPLMSNDLTLQTYLATLQRIYGIATAWETATEEQAPKQMQPMLRDRRRASRIVDDIRALGSELLPPVQPEMPNLRSEAEFLGAMYVMEGSRLGGIFIAKHVVSVLRIKEGFGDTYFRGDPLKTGSMWREFLEYLRIRVPEDGTANVIQGAKLMFQLYGTWMSDLPAENNATDTRNEQWNVEGVPVNGA
jgi:heme oxygenase